MTEIDDPELIAQFDERMAQLHKDCDRAWAECRRHFCWQMAWLFVAASLLFVGASLWMADYGRSLVNVAIGLTAAAAIGSLLAFFRYTAARERGRKAAYEMQALLIWFGRVDGA